MAYHPSAGDAEAGRFLGTTCQLCVKPLREIPLSLNKQKASKKQHLRFFGLHKHLFTCSQLPTYTFALVHTRTCMYICTHTPKKENRFITAGVYSVQGFDPPHTKTVENKKE